MKKGILWALCLSTIFFGASLWAEPLAWDARPQISVSSPREERDEKYRKFLSVSMKINVSGASGSGTICHYDSLSGIAHIISCGHLWSGNMSYENTSKGFPKAKVITWYKNSVKLERPETFEAEVLFWSNDRGYDVSLLRFKPDWKPDFTPIDTTIRMEKGISLNSLGCDGGKEVARYEVIFERMNDADIITVRNSPRPGRSGGGLITNSGKMVGVCWGTSDTQSGNGIGYFTPTSAIKKVFVKNGYGWLLDLSGARSIPIMDAENPEARYPESFVPFPLDF